MKFNSQICTTREQSERQEGKDMKGLFIKSIDYRLLCQLKGMGYTAVRQDIYFGGTMVTNDGKMRHPIAPYKPWNPDGRGWPECEVFDNEADFLKAAAEMIKEAK